MPKLSTAQVQALLGKMSSAAGPVFTAGTNASPAVFTKTAHGLKVGDVIVGSGMTGMTAFNDVLQVATVPTADTVTFNKLSTGAELDGNGTFGGSPVTQKISVAMSPGDLTDILDTLAEMSNAGVQGSVVNRPNESTLKTIFGV